MAGSGDIVQNIVLAGQSDVIAGLNSIGSAGVQAFSALASAASSVSLSGPLGAIVGFSAALATVTAGFFEWSAASSNATIRTANFGDELGTSAQQMTTLITALAQGGNQVTDLTTSFRRLAVSVESEWPTIQKSVRNSTNLMKEDYIKVNEANVALQFSTEKLSEQQQRDALDVRKANLSVAESKLNLVKTDNEVSLQMQANAVDVLSAEAQLSNALFALEHIRSPASKQEKEAQAEQQAQIAVLQAQLALKRAIQKQETEATEAELKHRQAVLQIQEARQRVQEAQTKAAEDAALAPLRQQKAELDAAKAQSEAREHQANDIANLKQYVDNLATGASNANAKVQLSSANLVKGLIASVGPGVSALDEFKGSLGDLGLSAPKLYDVMLKVSDIFKNTTDETLRAAIATALFGRGYSFSLVEALSKGSDALKAAQQQIAQTFDLTKSRVDEQVSVAREFRAALNSLAEGVSLVSKQISTIISPIFSTILRQIELGVEANRLRFLGWAQSIRDSLTPAITGFISAITGVNLADAFKLTPEQILKAVEWKQATENIRDGIITGFTAVKNFLTSTLPAAFDIVMSGFNAIASVINSFGGSVTGTQVAIALLIGQFTGLNNVIISVVLGIGGIVLALAANPFGPIILGVAGAIAALTLLGVYIYRNREQISQWLNAKYDVSFGLFDKISDAFDDLILKIRRGVEDAKRLLSDLLNFRSSADAAAEQAKVNASRAEEDKSIAQQRAERNPTSAPSEGIASPSLFDPSNPSSEINRPKTVEEAYKSLGDTITRAMEKGKKSVDEVTEATRKQEEEAKKAAQAWIAQQKQITDQATRSAEQTQAQQTATQESAQTAADKEAQQLVDNMAYNNDPNSNSAPFISKGYGPNINPRPSRPFRSDSTPVGGGGIPAPVGTQNTADNPNIPPRPGFVYGPGFGQRLQQIQQNAPQIPPRVPSPNATPGASLADIAGSKFDPNNSTHVVGEKDRIEQINALKEDWRSQRALNADLARQGGVPKRKDNTYEKPIRGHYDENYNFVPDEPVRYSGGGRGISPATNDYYFGGEKNPAGPYQEGISAPIGFFKPTDAEAEENRRRRREQENQDAPAYAEGGTIGGKSGVDTNLIWATKGEYMQPTDAVAHYGESFMDAIRDKKIPKNMFALGGIISGIAKMSRGMIPRYAGGGVVSFAGSDNNSSAMQTPIHLHAPDGRTIGYGMADRDLAEGITRFATEGQRYATGVSPTWRT